MTSDRCTAVYTSSLSDRSLKEQAMATADDYLYQFRLILIGDSTVGKSSLLRQFKEGTYFQDVSLTVGVDFHAKIVHLKGQPVKLQLWDTAGQDRFRAIVKAYYRNAVGGLLVFDITNRESFAHLNEWLEDAKKNADRSREPVFLLVGNKSDQDKHREVLKEEGLRYAREHNMEYIETSARTGTRVEEAFQMIAQRIYSLLEEGYIKMEDGWDGVKKGDPIRRSVSPLRNSSRQTSISLATDGPRSEETSGKKCCTRN